MCLLNVHFDHKITNLKKNNTYIQTNITQIHIPKRLYINKYQQINIYKSNFFKIQNMVPNYIYGSTTNTL